MGPDEEYQRQLAQYERRLGYSDDPHNAVSDQQSRHFNEAVAGFHPTDGNMQGIDRLYGDQGAANQNMNRVFGEFADLFGDDVAKQVFDRVLQERGREEQTGYHRPVPEGMPPALGVPQGPSAQEFQAQKAANMQQFRDRGVHRDNPKSINNGIVQNAFARAHKQYGPSGINRATPQRVRQQYEGLYGPEAIEY